MDSCSYDVGMDQSQDSDNVKGRDGAEENDSEEASQTTVLLVNEEDLEGELLVNSQIILADLCFTATKAKYDTIHTVYVYSLAPVPLIVRISHY
jgi:hypothetical protein